jgi:hypothetical protein
MFLPGALKYGGVHGFLSLCTSGRTLAVHVLPAGRELAGIVPPQVTHAPPQKLDELVTWLLE